MTDNQYEETVPLTREEKKKQRNKDKRSILEKLEEKLELEELPEEENQEVEVVDAVPANASNVQDQQAIDDDYEFIRKQLRDIIETSEDAYKSLLEFAQSTDDPKLHMALSKVIKERSDAVYKLMETAKTKKETEHISSNTEGSGPNNQQNNFHFYGDSKDALKKLKNGEG